MATETESIAPPLRTDALAEYSCTLSGVTAISPDGRKTPLDGCCWMIVSPCGCVSGVTTAVQGDKVLLSPGAALRSMSANVADYREDVRNGTYAILVPFDDYRGGAGDLFKIDCPHTPRFGVARKQREIGGTTWTRIGSTRWTAKGGWSIEKYDARWHMSGPTDGPGRYRSPYIGTGKLDEALSKASAFIAGHPLGLERVTTP